MAAIPQLKRNVQSLKIDREVQNPTHGFSPFFWIEVVEEIRLVTVDTPVSDTVRNVDMIDVDSTCFLPVAIVDKVLLIDFFWLDGIDLL